MLGNSHEHICKPSALFLRVCRSDIASFDRVVLVSFVAQVRSIMFYDFEVPGACSGESFVVARRPDNACDANYLDVTLVQGTVLSWSCQSLDGRTTVTHDARSARQSTS